MIKNESGFSFVELLIVLLLLICLGMTGFIVYSRSRTQPLATTPTSTPNVKRVSESKTLKLTGKITAINNGCQVDGICSITIGGKEIITNKGDGETQELHGNIIGSEKYSDSEKIGKTVEVYAQIINEKTLTLYGSPDYFIKYLN